MRPHLRVLASLAVFILLLVASAQAQITVTEEDERATVGKRISIQTFVAETPSNFQTLFEKSGEGKVFDFRPYDYAVESEGVQDRRRIENASSEAPFIQQYENAGAGIVAATRLNAVAVAGADSTFWDYERTSENQFELFGASYIIDLDADGDGEKPDTLEFQYNPPLIHRPLPLNYGDTWSQITGYTISVLGTEVNSEIESEVDGYGTLKTPAGSVPVLRLRSSTIDTTSLAGIEQVSRTTTVTFVPKDARFTASILHDDDKNEILRASYSVLADRGTLFQIGQGETPTVSAHGAVLTFDQASSTSGQVDISRYDTTPFNNTYSGSATSGDGTSITPNTVWDERYYDVRSQNLNDFSATICLDFDPTPGISDDGKLVVLKRETASQSWSPLDSFVDNNQLCARTISTFSQFAVGSNSTHNSLPVELMEFTATVDDSDGILQWRTASETNNVGFEVQHQPPTAADYSTEGFVKGTGTTTAAQQYRYRVEDLALGSHRFRLNQIDTDGTTSLSSPVQISVRGARDLMLEALGSNPVRQSTEFRLAVPKPGNVTVTLFNVLGQKERVLYEGRMTPGRIRTVGLQTENLPSGTYFVRLSATTGTRTRRLVVVH